MSAIDDFVKRYPLGTEVRLQDGRIAYFGGIHSYKGIEFRLDVARLHYPGSIDGVRAYHPWMTKGALVLVPSLGGELVEAFIQDTDRIVLGQLLVVTRAHNCMQYVRIEHIQPTNQPQPEPADTLPVTYLVTVRRAFRSADEASVWASSVGGHINIDEIPTGA